ncbi:unnamed protein product, partial [Polarella glacialis]
EALLHLEVAFGRRGFSLISAQLITSGDLIEQTYLLKYTGRKESRHELATLDSDFEIEICLVPSSESQAQFTAKVSGICAAREQLLRVRVHGDYRIGMRTSVMEVLRKKQHQGLGG